MEKYLLKMTHFFKRRIRLSVIALSYIEGALHVALATVML